MDAVASREVTLPALDPLCPTVFHEHWWLEAVTDGRYQEVTVEAGGRIVGRLPFMRGRMLAGHALCGMPELTHFLGPAIDAGTGNPTSRALKRDGILRDLLARMSNASGFFQKLHRNTADTLVFQEHGYLTTVQFTYDLPPAPTRSLWTGMRDKTRNVIRRAEEQHTVVDLTDPAYFTAIYEQNLLTKGLTNQYHRVRPLCEAILARNRGRIIAAIDTSGAVAAAIVYVWDAVAGYYLLTTRRPDAGNGAVALLIWHAIQDCASRDLVFDFDGVAAAGSRIFYAGFGGKVVPRYIVSRYTFGHRLIGRLSNPWRRPAASRFQV